MLGLARYTIHDSVTAREPSAPCMGVFAAGSAPILLHWWEMSPKRRDAPLPRRPCLPSCAGASAAGFASQLATLGPDRRSSFILHRDRSSAALPRIAVGRNHSGR